MPTLVTSWSMTRLFPSGDSMVVSAVPAKRSSSRRHKVRFALSMLLQVHLRHVIGRWPEKSVRFITRLLKNAESNADAKSLDLENLVIKNIVVQQAPVCLSYFTPVLKLTYLDNRKLGVAHTAPMVALTPIKVIPVMSKLFLRHRRKR
jgi:Ribosomal protein L22p/L17e